MRINGRFTFDPVVRRVMYRASVIASDCTGDEGMELARDLNQLLISYEPVPKVREKVNGAKVPGPRGNLR